MKENYLERPSASWKSLSLVQFMKESTWKGLLRAGNPYPGAFYEGEVLGKAFCELQINILVHFMKENYLERPSASWNYLERPSATLCWCIL